MNEYTALDRPATSGGVLGRLPLYRRMARARGAFVRPYLFFIAGVAAAAALYFFLLAAPLYTADAQIAVRGKQALTTNTLFAAALGQQQPGAMEGAALVTFVESAEMLRRLEAGQHLRAQYSAFRPDFFYHLPAHASGHRFLRFYRGMVDVSHDTATGLIDLRVRAFDPRAAQATAAAILDNAQDFVGNLSRQMLSESSRAAQADVDEARAGAVKAHAALAAFQGRANRLDPGAFGTATQASYFALGNNIAQLRSQLASLRTYTTEQAPQVQQLRASIANLEGQQRELQQRLTGQQAGGTVLNQLATFQRLSLDQQYADQRLTVAQSALDQSRSVAQQRQLFIVPVTSPGLPDEPTPRRWWGFFSVLAVATTLYVIARLAIASIRDHQI